MGAPACAVLSLTDWHPKKNKKQESTQNPKKVHMCIMKTVIFRKQIENHLLSENYLSHYIHVHFEIPGHPQ